jgi:UDP-glucose 4-epimerase
MTGGSRETSTWSQPRVTVSTGLEHVVIVGQSGFIGSALARYARAAGASVVGYSSADLDLRDQAALSRLDDTLTSDSVLFVPAALTPDRGAGLDTLQANLGMSLNLARYLEKHPVRQCVYFSSDAVYPMLEQPVDEHTCVEPSSLYALAKYAGERMLEQAAARSGSALLILRPTAVYGPGDTHASYGPNRFVRSAVAEHAVRLFGQGEEQRDHLFIDDLVRAAWALASSPARSATVNLASGTSRSFASVAEDLRSLAPFEISISTAPRQSVITHRHFDIGRLRAALPGFEFTPFRDGLKQTLDAALAG